MITILFVQSKFGKDYFTSQIAATCLKETCLLRFPKNAVVRFEFRYGATILRTFDIYEQRIRESDLMLFKQQSTLPRRYTCQTSITVYFHDRWWFDLCILVWIFESCLFLINTTFFEWMIVTFCLGLITYLMNDFMLNVAFDFDFERSQIQPCRCL